MIKLKIKKCKPSGRAKGFESKKNPETHSDYIQRFGMCKSCLAEWLFETTEGVKLLNKYKLKSSKNIEKEQKDFNKQQKEDIKTHGDLLKELQTDQRWGFNRLIRLIDTNDNHGCISCNHGWDGEFTQQKHAGHYWSVGGHNNLRFNANNVYLQCVHCNKYAHANIIGYNSGLKEVFGEDYFNIVQELKQHPALNLTKSDIRDLKIKVRELIKRAEKFEPLSRDYINEYLGIYKKL